MAEVARILVTGANGFVGRLLMRALAKAFPTAQIAGWAGPTDPRQEDDPEPAVRVDLTNADSVRAIIKDTPPDIVFHLAAHSSVGEALGNEGDTWRVNALGTLNLAEALRAHAPHATAIFASSAEVYGRSFLAGAPLKEDAPLAPTSAYGRSKAAAENILTDLAAPESRLVVLRLFNHTGPGQDERFVAPSFAAQIARIEAGKAPPLLRVGNLHAERDFCDVTDVVEAYIAAANESARLPRLNLFNVCSGVTRPISELLDELVALSSAKVTIEADPQRLRPAEIARAAGDGEAFAKQFKWTASTPLRTTLERLLTFWREREGV